MNFLLKDRIIGRLGTKRPNTQTASLALLLCLALLSSCSTTSNLPEGEQLYRGIKEINISRLGDWEIGRLDTKNPNDQTTKQLNDQLKSHLADTKLELAAALASPPNGAILGSSKLKSPFTIGLWIYNAFANEEKGFGKWMRNSFGKRWITINDVNPELHATVATNLLRSRGFFNANVSYKVITGKNPKKAKISYDVELNNVYVNDIIERRGFPHDIDSIMESSRDEWLIHTGDPFCASDLEAERSRLCEMLRNKGYYYYQKEYITFTADSVSKPGRVMLRISPSDNVPDIANKCWYIGHIRIQMRKNAREELTDSVTTRALTLLYNKERPIRPSVILRDITFRKGEPFSYDRYQQTAQNFASAGLYSSYDFNFAPREGTDTVDVTLNCVFDKPYDVTFEAGVKGNSNSRLGPNLTLGLTKRNAFHGGESLSFNLFGDYQWQLRKNKTDGGSANNYYVYGFKASLQYPRLETPFHIFTKKRRRYFATPKTDFYVSYNTQNRPGYFKYVTLSAGVTYQIQTNAVSRHEFSPIIFDYSFVSNRTDKYYELIAKNMSLIKLEDLLVPKIQYSYTYSSPGNYQSPIVWRTTISEASNLLALGYSVAGKKWNEKGKELFNNPFMQFVKLESDFVKYWHFDEKNTLVFHANGGMLYSYGNSKLNQVAYNEQFFAGGANSLRAFPSHGIGPGNATPDLYGGSFSVLRIGTVKFEANLEYRFGIAGNLSGALFIDAGNVWNIPEKLSDEVPEVRDVLSKYNQIHFFRELATDAGVGLRYDLGFLVLRVDWAGALHLPYDTSKKGYFNVDDFGHNNNLHFAIGLPF